MNAKSWDLLVIGGGASGMMAAGRAAELGARVLLLEKNSRLGEKLLITGGGRCNVTNSEFDNRKLLEKFKDAQKFLFSAFSQHSVKDSLEFFHSNNMPTKVENNLRTFPTTDKAESVWDVLVENMKKYKVEIRSKSEVKKILVENNQVIGVELRGGEVVSARSYILATGGTSRPETGSTGEGFRWLSDIGHQVRMPTPSLVPVAVKDEWVKTHSGKTLEDVKITVTQNGDRQKVARGKILLTHFGLSGPTILNMSRDIGELLDYGEVTLHLDPLPDEDYSTLNTKLQELFKLHDKKKLQNALLEILPSFLVEIVLEKNQIDGDTPCNSVRREDRIKLTQVMKNITIEVEGLLSEDKAIIASGGVDLTEVDFRTMQSKLYPNLYLIGDILDIDRPSGGYSLQLCWTTGFVAGTHSAKK